jgi:TPR repeat protein
MNNAFAQFRLGWMYSQGLGIEKDETKAAEYYLKSFSNNDISSACNLGMLFYAEGVVGKNISLSENLLFISSDAGVAKAQVMLAWLHTEEEFASFEHFIYKNDIEDLKWVLLSMRAETDRDPYPESRLTEREIENTALALQKRLTERMSPAQITQAEQRAQEWQPREPTSEEITALVAQVKAQIEKNTSQT